MGEGHNHGMDALQYLCSRLGFVNSMEKDNSIKKARARNKALLSKRKRLLGNAYAG
jgi:hypothetical protein